MAGEKPLIAVGGDDVVAIPPPPDLEVAEWRQQRRENAELRRKLEAARLAIDIQKSGGPDGGLCNIFAKWRRDWPFTEIGADRRNDLYWRKPAVCSALNLRNNPRRQI